MRKITPAQYPLVFLLDVTADDFGTNVAVDVPPGFIVTNVTVVTRTAFNGTTPTIAVKDNKDTPTTLVAATAVTAAGSASAAAAAIGTDYPSGGTISVTLANGGGTTNAGEADVIVQGIVRSRQNERYGA